MERMDILNASTLILGWAKSQYSNTGMIDLVANEIIAKAREKLFFEEDTVKEVANIM